LGKANIHPVNHRDDIKQEQVRDQPKLELANRFLLEELLDRATRDRCRVFCAPQKTPSMSVANRERSAFVG
jgi:hypothetical protein